MWFHVEDENIVVDIPPGSKWMKFNVGQFGYYRVNYPIEDWKTISEQLMTNHDVFTSPSDRTHLLNDAFSLAEAERVPYTVPLDLTKYLRKETSDGPWVGVIAKFRYLQQVFYYSGDIFANLLKYQKFLGLMS